MEKKYLFVDWSFCLRSFMIYDSYVTMNIITKRIIEEDGYTNWFNIDNIKKEIISYSKKNNIKIGGLKETINDIHTKGFSYTNKTKHENILSAEEKNKNGIKIKIIE